MVVHDIYLYNTKTAALKFYSRSYTSVKQDSSLSKQVTSDLYQRNVWKGQIITLNALKDERKDSSGQLYHCTLKNVTASFPSVMRTRALLGLLLGHLASLHRSTEQDGKYSI